MKRLAENDIKNQEQDNRINKNQEQENRPDDNENTLDDHEGRIT
jgi:hypothetical protein